MAKRMIDRLKEALEVINEANEWASTGGWEEDKEDVARLLVDHSNTFYPEIGTFRWVESSSGEPYDRWQGSSC